MCRGTTEREIKLDISVGIHVSLSSPIVHCSVYQDFIFKAFSEQGLSNFFVFPTFSARVSRKKEIGIFIDYTAKKYQFFLL